MTGSAPNEDRAVEVQRLFPQIRESDRDYDMVDEPERETIARFPPLERGLAILNERVAPMYFRSDAEALRLQARHRWFATVSVCVGGAVVVFAILQLTFGAVDRIVAESPPWLRSLLAGSSSVARTGELIGLILCAVAVGVGLWVAAQIGWLRERHKAELCRVLKFRSLADPLLWQGAYVDWGRELEANIAKIEKIDTLTWQDLQERALHDPVRELPLRVETATIAPELLRGLAGYYLSKRIRCQRTYFERRARKYERTARWLRRLPMGCFFGSIGAAFSHFAIEFAGGWLDPTGVHHEAWSLAAMSGLALAAILPVVGAGVRAYRSAHEFARSAALFHAKASAMGDFEEMVSRPLGSDADAPRLIRIVLDCEKFLEAEHREWLRLMLESEWFG